MIVLQKLIFEKLKGKEEWKDLIMQNPPQIEPKVLVTGEPADKKPDEGLVLQQMVKLPDLVAGET